MIGVPAFVLTLIGILFFLALLYFAFMPSMLSTNCSAHTIGYEYVCKLMGYNW